MWSPISVGDGRPSHHTFTTDSGIFNLTGVANTDIAMHMEDINSNNALYICTGAWNVTDAPGGKADFTPSPADLTTGYLGRGGLYTVYPVVSLPSGPVPMDSQMLLVENRP